MSEKDKQIFSQLAESFEKLDSGNKKYIAGIADGLVLANEAKNKTEEREET